jgi:hypothetical protein
LRHFIRLFKILKKVLTLLRRCKYSFFSSLIGCRNRREDLGIPQTQAGRSGSGLGGSRGAQAQTVGDRPRLPPATPTLRRRPTPPPPPPRPAAWPGPAQPGSGRRLSRSGRGEASVIAPGRTAGTGAAVLGCCRLRTGRVCSQSSGGPATRAGGPIPSGPGPGGYPGCWPSTA